MFRKASSKNLVGLDIGSSSVKAVELAKKGANYQLLNLGFENLQTDTIVDGQIMELNNVSNVISHIFSEHQIRTTRVAAGVSGHSVIVKNIVLPAMSQEELQESFSWHAEEHIPFDIGDVNLDYELTGKSSETLHVLMAACKSDKIANVKQAIQLAGKQPVIIDVDAFALQNCYEVNYHPRPGEIVALLNIGAATMNINILNGTRSMFARDASAGGSQYTSLLQRELGLSFEQAEGVKRGMALPEGIEPRPIQPIIETVSMIGWMGRGSMPSGNAIPRFTPSACSKLRPSSRCSRLVYWLPPAEASRANIERVPLRILMFIVAAPMLSSATISPGRG